MTTIALPAWKWTRIARMLARSETEDQDDIDAVESFEEKLEAKGVPLE